MNKVLAICIDCGRCKVCGEDCIGCKSRLDFSSKIADYTDALKTAVSCWQNAACNEHEEHGAPCPSTLREFAEKFLELNQKNDILESAIRSHKELKKTADEFDRNLWQIVN